MTFRIVGVTIVGLLLMSCGNSPDSRDQELNKQLLSTAESFIDAFYSYDSNALRAALSSAEDSTASLLFYQGWAEGGSYEVVERMPCVFENEGKISCSFKVKDDLMGALGINFNVTDTFHLEFSDGRVIAVTTSSNDPQEYYDAENWVKKNRPDLIDEPCERTYLT